jgi:hypothetical protein
MTGIGDRSSDFSRNLFLSQAQTYRKIGGFPHFSGKISKIGFGLQPQVIVFLVSRAGYPEGVPSKTVRVNYSGYRHIIRYPLANDLSRRIEAYEATSVINPLATLRSLKHELSASPIG